MALYLGLKYTLLERIKYQISSLNTRIISERRCVMSVQDDPIVQAHVFIKELFGGKEGDVDFSKVVCTLKNPVSTIDNMRLQPEFKILEENYFELFKTCMEDYEFNSGHIGNYFEAKSKIMDEKRKLEFSLLALLLLYHTLEKYYKGARGTAILTEKAIKELQEENDEPVTPTLSATAPDPNSYEALAKEKPDEFLYAQVQSIWAFFKPVLEKLDPNVGDLGFKDFGAYNDYCKSLEHDLKSKKFTAVEIRHHSKATLRTQFGLRLKLMLKYILGCFEDGGAQNLKIKTDSSKLPLVSKFVLGCYSAMSHPLKEARKLTYQMTRTTVLSEEAQIEGQALLLVKSLWQRSKTSTAFQKALEPVDRKAEKLESLIRKMIMQKNGLGSKKP